MIKYLLLLLPLFAHAQLKAPVGVVYDLQILRVIDGDTVSVSAPFLPKPLKPELALRVYGVDTPEKGSRAKCPEEDKRAQAATDFTKQSIALAQYRQVMLYEWDKYGGRILGDILLNGKSLRTMLISNGHAREYYGEAKQSWCQL